MFPVNQSPSLADVARLEAFQSRMEGETIGDAAASTEELLRLLLKRRENDVADLLALYTSPDEAQKIYPAPPLSLLRTADDRSTLAPSSMEKGAREDVPLTGAILQALKKARRENATAALHAASSSTTAGSGSRSGVAADGSPRASFVEGVERVNYLGKSFLEPPSSLLEHEEEMQRKVCRPPRMLRGVFKIPEEFQSSATAPPTASAAGSTGVGSSNSGASAKLSGVQQLRWAPPAYGHLLFSGDLSGQCRLWNSSTRQMLATFSAHVQPIKSVEVTSNAAIMSTGSVDGTVAMWDVEAGVCAHVLTNPGHLPVVQHLHHPSDEAHLLLAAVDKKVVLYDVRTSCTKYQREYAGHMGTIFNLTLLSDGRKMLTTSEDKTLRTWDYRSPVQIKQFADAAMHAITHVLHHPTQPEFLAAQSLNNKVIVFHDEGGGRLRLLHDREFTGHTISGTRCQLGFSRDGRYLSSGDISGKLYVWDWASKKMEKSFKAHAQMLTSHLWHPIEPTKVVTAAWDGNLHSWA